MILYVWFMSSNAKIYLSQQEQQLILDSDWILTKRSILEKVSNLFGEISTSLTAILNEAAWLPEEIQFSNAKISRGENYQGLPYLILDHPGYFKKEDIFAIRTMFWWGNFYSVTLHLSGKYKYLFQKRIFSNIQQISAPDNLYLCVNENQWQHHFEQNNYILLQSLQIKPEPLILQNTFLKLAVRYPLEKLENAGDLVIESIGLILKLLKP